MTFSHGLLHFLNSLRKWESHILFDFFEFFPSLFLLLLHLLLLLLNIGEFAQTNHRNSNIRCSEPADIIRSIARIQNLLLDNFFQFLDDVLFL